MSVFTAIERISRPLGVLSYRFYHFSHMKIGSLINTNYKSQRKFEQQQAMLKNNGYVVVENYISSEDARVLAAKFVDFLKENKNLSVKNGDVRIYGIETQDALFHDFFSDKDLASLASKFYGFQSCAAFTLGGAVSEVGTNSGGGWHRDAIEPQFKAMLYLTDVNEDNAPFEIVEQTHTAWSLAQISKKFKISLSDDRFTDELVQQILSEYNLKVKKITGKAGTLVIFDSSALHRGSELISGERLSLTNYYYPKKDTPLRRAQFKCI